MKTSYIHIKALTVDFLQICLTALLTRICFVTFITPQKPGLVIPCQSSDSCAWPQLLITKDCNSLTNSNTLNRMPYPHMVIVLILLDTVGDVIHSFNET